MRWRDYCSTGYSTEFRWKTDELRQLLSDPVGTHPRTSESYHVTMSCPIQSELTRRPPKVIMSRCLVRSSRNSPEDLRKLSCHDVLSDPVGTHPRTSESYHVTMSCCEYQALKQTRRLDFGQTRYRLILGQSERKGGVTVRTSGVLML